MNNTTTPSPNRVKLSASQSTTQLPRSVPKSTSTFSQSQYPPLSTPETTNNSISHLPQQVQDYISHRPSEHASRNSNTSPAQRLRQQYPFFESCKSYTEGTLPPWEVMYELTILYFTNINSLLPLISEPTIFDVVLDPQRLKGEDSPVQAILMAITVVTMRFLLPEGLSIMEQDYYVKKCRAALASPAISKTREGMQALAVLLLESNGQMCKDETATILGQVNDRLWQKEGGRERKPQSPLSVSEMLCGP